MKIKLFAAAALMLSLFAGASAQTTPEDTTAQKMTITRSDTLTSSKGPEQYFTGNVSVESLFPVNPPSRTSGASVTFEPGARSAWHTHPLGQTLIVTAGTGWVQQWGGEKQEIRSGDVVWTPPGVKHWHGATATTAMTHIAINETLDGKNVEWMEKVTDDRYNVATTRSGAPSASFTQTTQPSIEGRRLSSDDVRRVAPALEKYTQDRLYGEVWKRPGLSRRDRSIVTITTLIARNQTPALNYYLNQALDNGVKPSEISEIITHLAFYSGWANAFAAIGPTKDVFAQRRIASDQIPLTSGTPLPLDKEPEAQRAARVEQDFGQVAPGVVQYTTDVLFRDLWLRPGLAPRDRSLVTVAALISSGQVAQIPYHLNRAMDNGLTKAEASEVLTQLAFYAGWPNVFSAMPVIKGVFETRSK
jgi:4-carboxymuconolactone decarboxylase